MKFSNLVGYNVRRLKTRGGLTHRECYEGLGFSRPTWYRILDGSRPALTGRVIDNLAAFFSVNIRDLLRKPR